MSKTKMHRPKCIIILGFRSLTFIIIIIIIIIIKPDRATVIILAQVGQLMYYFSSPNALQNARNRLLKNIIIHEASNCNCS